MSTRPSPSPLYLDSGLTEFRRTTNPYDGHTLAQALKPAILSNARLEVMIVDCGYQGLTIGGLEINNPGLRCGITRGLTAMIRR